MFICIPKSKRSMPRPSETDHLTLVNSNYIAEIKICEMDSAGKKEASILLLIAEAARNEAMWINGYSSKERVEEIVKEMLIAMHRGDAIFQMPDA